MLDSWRSTGRTIPRLKHVLTVIYDIRYTTIDILKTCKNPAFQQVVTGPSFAELINLKVLSEEGGIFSLGPEGFKIIDKPPYRLRGGGEHDLAVARHVLQAITDHGATVIYPRFERQRLIPDALLIYKGENQYRLEFLEVELSAKPDGYLAEKLKKYEALGKDQTLYTDWWRAVRERIGLAHCNINQFCFGVRVENEMVS